MDLSDGQGFGEGIDQENFAVHMVFSVQASFHINKTIPEFIKQKSLKVAYFDANCIKQIYKLKDIQI